MQNVFASKAARSWLSTFASSVSSRFSFLSSASSPAPASFASPFSSSSLFVPKWVPKWVQSTRRRIVPSLPPTAFLFGAVPVNEDESLDPNHACFSLFEEFQNSGIYPVPDPEPTVMALNAYYAILEDRRDSIVKKAQKEGRQLDNDALIDEIARAEQTDGKHPTAMEVKEIHDKFQADLAEHLELLQSKSGVWERYIACMKEHEPEAYTKYTKKAEEDFARFKQFTERAEEDEGNEGNEGNDEAVAAAAQALEKD